MNKKPTVYLAGPDVFFRDADARYNRLEAMCEKYGLIGMRPSDGGIQPQEWATLPKREIATRLFEGNMERLRNADIILANMTPYRGDEPDSGSVFEVGAAVALGKVVVAYTPMATTTMHNDLESKYGVEKIVNDKGESILIDKKFGVMIEDFESPLNLMISVPCKVLPDAESAIKQAIIDLSMKPDNNHSPRNINTP